MVEQIEMIHVAANPLMGLWKTKILSSIGMPAQSAIDGHQTVPQKMIAGEAGIFTGSGRNAEAVYLVGERDEDGNVA